MLNRLTMAIALATLLAVAGCEKTVEGMKDDAATDSAKAAEASRDLGSAMRLTPAIKAAIMADPTLNDPGNLINVESSEEQVVLKGHVKNEMMKTLAGDIARRTVEDQKGSQTIVNELQLKP